MDRAFLSSAPRDQGLEIEMNITQHASNEFGSIVNRNAQSIAAMEVRAINYGPGPVAADAFVSAVKQALGHALSARELIEHDDCDAMLTDAVRQACANLDISSVGLHVRATHAGRSIVSC
jgi:hypothetical protein